MADGDVSAEVRVLKQRLARVGVSMDGIDAAAVGQRGGGGGGGASLVAHGRVNVAMPSPTRWESELMDILQRCNDIDRTLECNDNSAAAADDNSVMNNWTAGTANDETMHPADAVLRAASSAATAAAHAACSVPVPGERTDAADATVAAAAATAARAAARAANEASRCAALTSSPQGRNEMLGITLPTTTNNYSAGGGTKNNRRKHNQRPSSATSTTRRPAWGGSGRSAGIRVRGTAYDDNSAASTAFWLQRCKQVEAAAKEAQAQSSKERNKLRKAAEREARKADDAIKEAEVFNVRAARAEAELAALKAGMGAKDKRIQMLEQQTGMSERRWRSDRKGLADAVGALTKERDQLMAMLTAAMSRLEVLSDAVRQADGMQNEVSDRVKRLEAEHGEFLVFVFACCVILYLYCVCTRRY